MSKLLVILLLLVPVTSFAQDCTPTPQAWLASGDGQRGVIPNPDTDFTTNLVPPGFIYLIYDASIGYWDKAYTPAQPIEVTLIKQILWPDNTWWEQGLEMSYRQTTPLGSWSKVWVLRPRQRLAARFAQRAGLYYVMYTGVIVPEACLTRVLGLQAPTVTSSGGTGVTTLGTYKGTGTVTLTLTPQ